LIKKRGIGLIGGECAQREYWCVKGIGVSRSRQGWHVWYRDGAACNFTVQRSGRAKREQRREGKEPWIRDANQVVAINDYTWGREATTRRRNDHDGKTRRHNYNGKKKDHYEEKRRKERKEREDKKRRGGREKRRKHQEQDTTTCIKLQVYKVTVLRL
jgi:hypothetical protein